MLMGLGAGPGDPSEIMSQGDSADMSSATFLNPTAFQTEDKTATPLFSQLTKPANMTVGVSLLTAPATKRKAFTHKVNRILKHAGINLKHGSALKRDVLLGLPLWSVLALGAMFSTTALIIATSKKKRELVASNPRGSSSPELEKAKKFREDFHWGNKTRKIVSKNFAKVPATAVKLGDVDEIVYRTRKRGEKAQLFQHAFEGKRPMLAMDIDNKKLHFVGGSYTVTADGITG